MGKAYFIGIAGNTMSALAKAFKDMGWEISGSDQEKVYPPITTFLEKNGVSYFKGYKKENLPFFADLVVVGRSALMVDPNNPEYLKAKQAGLKILSYPQVVSEYIVKENSIVVSGTFGKSTTTALITWILINAGLDPSFMFGGIPLNFNGGTKITDSNYSVVEGDETPALTQLDKPKFLFYKPKYLVITATEYDHPEVYLTEESYLQTYIDLIKLLPADGILIYDEDTVSRKVVSTFNGKKVTFSIKNSPKISENFNESAVRALTLCRELGIDKTVINQSILSFKGLCGRRELLGEFSGRLLYYDVSQQASKVKGTVDSFRERYRSRRILIVFNPSATSLKFKESLRSYGESFRGADKVIITKVDYLSSIPAEERVTGPDLVRAFGGSEKVIYNPLSGDIVKWLGENTDSSDVVVFMSSGGLDFTRLIEEVKGRLKND